MPVQPNILIVMVDQLAGTFFPDGPARFLHAPNLARLAEESVRFNANYCASPLCSPSRVAFMTGQLPSRTGVYDNAAEFASSVPTFAHHLRRLGYRTALCGKMHFVGPDQLHGFEERLTTDIYPADFGWTPDWTKPGERIDWWYHNLASVTEAGVAEMTNQLEHDDEVAHFARQRIFDFARKGDGRPFCLTVSFTHPHDPYVMRQKYWDFYRDADIPMPAVSVPDEAHDPHSRRILESCDFRRYDVTQRKRPRRPPCLLRRDLLSRREDRRAPRSPANLRLCGEHCRGLHLRPRRHARRARPLVQDEFFRGERARAADDPRPGFQARGSSEPPASSTCCRRSSSLPAARLRNPRPLDGKSLVPLALGAASPAAAYSPNMRQRARWRRS